MLMRIQIKNHVLFSTIFFLMRQSAKEENQITQERKHIVQPDCPHFHFFAIEPTAVELQLPPSILKMPKISGKCFNQIKKYIKSTRHYHIDYIKFNMKNDKNKVSE